MASTATNLGHGMRVVALPLLATTVTTDVRQIALVAVATFAHPPPGRVSADNRMLYALLFPSGAVVAGLLASAVGTRLTILVSAIPILLAALLLPNLRRPVAEAWARTQQSPESGDTAG